MQTQTILFFSTFCRSNGKTGIGRERDRRGTVERERKRESEVEGCWMRLWIMNDYSSVADIALHRNAKAERGGWEKDGRPDLELSSCSTPHICQVTMGRSRR